jgi:hypothetical protein
MCKAEPGDSIQWLYDSIVTPLFRWDESRGSWKACSGIKFAAKIEGQPGFTHGPFEVLDDLMDGLDPRGKTVRCIYAIHPATDPLVVVWLNPDLPQWLPATTVPDSFCMTVARSFNEAAQQNETWRLVQTEAGWNLHISKDQTQTAGAQALIYNAALALRITRLPELERQVAELQKELKEARATAHMLIM